MIKRNIEKEGHNIPKLSIWRHYGNKKRHIPTEVNKSYAQWDEQRVEYLTRLFEETYIKDIIERNHNDYVEIGVDVEEYGRIKEL